jgi:uncharacterized protein with GYD domain
MGKFCMTFDYSNASWARMLAVVDDRVRAVEELMEHFGGTFDAAYWEVDSAQAIVIGDFPDAVSATAAITAATKTGAFKDVRVREVLTQDQLRDVIDLAKSAEGVYRAPGSASVERDIA